MRKLTALVAHIYLTPHEIENDELSDIVSIVLRESSSDTLIAMWERGPRQRQQGAGQVLVQDGD